MYWEPHTSSIDFCERNYLHGHHVVELHNTWSSLVGIAAVGMIGALYNNPTHEFRTTIAYIILLLVGIGSMGLHWSLHWIYQASDELPMLYLINVLNFMCLEYDAPLGKPRSPSLAFTFFALSILETVVYYRFQNNYLFFCGVLTFSITLHTMQAYKILCTEGYKRGPIPKQLGTMSLVAFLIVGIPVWLLDMFHCDTILEYSDAFLGMTPHVLWHFAASLGTHASISCIVACRMEELEMPYRLEYIWHILPILVRAEDKTN